MHRHVHRRTDHFHRDNRDILIFPLNHKVLNLDSTRPNDSHCIASRLTYPTASTETQTLIQFHILYTHQFSQAWVHPFSDLGYVPPFQEFTYHITGYSPGLRLQINHDTYHCYLRTKLLQTFQSLHTLAVMCMHRTLATQLQTPTPGTPNKIHFQSKILFAMLRTTPNSEQLYQKKNRTLRLSMPKPLKIQNKTTIQDAS